MSRPTAFTADAVTILANRLRPPNQDKRNLDEFPIGTRIYGRRGTDYAKKFALSTGHFRRCGLEGCGAVRIRVRWPRGEIRWLCAKGLIPFRKNSKHWRLG